MLITIVTTANYWIGHINSFITSIGGVVGALVVIIGAWIKLKKFANKFFDRIDTLEDNAVAARKETDTKIIKLEETFNQKISKAAENIDSNMSKMADKIDGFEKKINEINRIVINVENEGLFHSFALKNLSLTEDSGWWKSDINGRTIEVSAHLLKLARRSEEELMGLGWLDFAHRDDRHRLLKSFNYSLETGVNFNEDYRWKMPDNKYIMVNAKTVPLVNKNNDIVSFYGIITHLEDSYNLNNAKKHN